MCRIYIIYKCLNVCMNKIVIVVMKKSYGVIDGNVTKNMISVGVRRRLFWGSYI